MREAQCVYVTVSENEGEIYFDGQTPAELKTYIKKMKWLKWERRLLADFSDKTDVDQFGINRNQRLANAFLENGMVLYYRKSRNDEFDVNYKQYVWG